MYHTYHCDHGCPVGGLKCANIYKKFYKLSHPTGIPMSQNYECDIIGFSRERPLKWYIYNGCSLSGDKYNYCFPMSYI